MSEENIYDVPRGSEAALSEDITSETESVCEEERVRKLFQACDADGDGYIDSQDLLSVCRELNLEDSLDELMRELGADESGRISYAEFLRRRLALRSEIDALRREQKGVRESCSRSPQVHQQIHRQPEPDYIPTSSDNSLGGVSAGKHESWEFDSGARDLSPEPASLQKLVEAAGGSTVSSTPSHLLDLANRLHLAALASLKAEVSDLTNRLHMVSNERTLLEKSLNKMQLEKMRVTREGEEQLEAQAQRYEERLTELHSVIAELSRKLERQRSHVIREDEEDEELAEDIEDFEDDACCSHNYVASDTEELSRDAELPGRTGETPDTREPVATSSGEDKPPRDATSCTSADIDNRAVEAGQSLQDMDVVHPAQLCHPSIKDLLDEIVSHKEENAKLRDEALRARTLLSAGRDERDKLRKKIQELQNSLQTIATLHSTFNSSNQESPSQSPRHVLSGSPLQAIKLTPGSSPALSGSPVPGHVPRDDVPVLKMAERVKLRRMETGDRQVTASDLSDLETWSTPVAEQLVLLQGLQGESSVQELLCHYLATSCNMSSVPSCTESATPVPAASKSEGKGTGEDRLMQQVMELQQLLPLREFELETERLRARGEHLRAQCDVLSLALDEARAHAEKLSLLCGKHESNTTALSLALSHSDTTIEAYDVLLALLESELGSLVATCRAAGIPAASHCPAVAAIVSEHDSPGLALAKVGDLRQTAESVASLLLMKLDRNCDSKFQDSVKHHGEIHIGWNQDEEYRLRDHIGRLKAERAKVRATAQPGLESVYADPIPRGRNPPSVTEARKLDLETAVLMQELMAMREDRAELKARCNTLEREKASLELRLSGQEAQRQAQSAALSSLQQQLKDSESRLTGSAVGEESQGRELAEALARESRLKERLQELMVSLETVSRSADIRHQQANEMLTEMKHANSALTVMLDKTKKKYQARIRKLEHQSVISLERHSAQVRVLKQRISVLESEISASNISSGLAANETSL